MSRQEILQYWAKTAKHGDLVVTHSCVFHGLDAGAVTDEMLRRRPMALKRFAELLGLDEQAARPFLAALVSLHDLGKFAPAFQAKAPEFWPECLGPIPRARGDDPSYPPHCSRALESSPRTRG